MSSSDRYSDQDADIDLGGLVGAIWRRRMLVLLSTVVIGGAAFGISSMVAPRYQAETQILIETRNPGLMSAQQNQSPTPEPILDEAGVASQVALLQSSDLIKQVAKTLNLGDRAEFDPAANPDLLTRILILTRLAKNPLDVPPEERILKEFTSKLQVYQVEKSRVIAIQFSSKDPKLAAQVPTEIAKVYLSLQSGAKLDTTSETAKWLEPEIANLREKVRDAEEKVAAYRSSADIYKTGELNTFAETQLNDISVELARVRGERANAEARAESVRATLKSGRNVDTLTDVVSSPMIQRLKETQSGIEGQIADLSTSLLDAHPKLLGLRSQLDGIRRQIRSETQKILSSLVNEASISRTRERQLIQQLNTLKADNAESEERQVGLKALEREATAQRQLLETYLARYREAVSRQDMNATPADARVISNASMPSEPYFPKILPITIVAALAGFILSSIFVMLAELFSGRAIRHSGPDYEEEPAAVAQPRRIIDEPVATAASTVEPDLTDEDEYIDEPAPTAAKPAVASLLSLELDAPALEKSMEKAADDFIEGEFSVNAVARHLVETDVNVAVSVSLSGDDGSTSTVILARTVAEMGRKTILVDMTGSALPTRLMAENIRQPGITDLLCGEAAFADTIHGDRLSDAHILPHGNANAKRAMRGAERLAMIVDALANAYDLVIVECGPANVEGVKRLARNGQAEIILSTTDANAEEIEAAAGSFIEAGYEDVVLLFGQNNPPSPKSGRKAA
ncbi:MAG: chain length determinant family protein [Rhizobium sp.]|nr:chain length determinant family protein [Rhizobium sp.]